mmetsp:Transcript_11110/g.33040  ORF Transcript_11110/g.33040 Transcript_11110/m.33040 type:complete len:239 (-) Transcript_11110:632-1348(-)
MSAAAAAGLSSSAEVPSPAEVPPSATVVARALAASREAAGVPVAKVRRRPFQAFLFQARRPPPAPQTPQTPPPAPPRPRRASQRCERRPPPPRLLWPPPWHRGQALAARPCLPPVRIQTRGLNPSTCPHVRAGMGCGIQSKSGRQTAQAAPRLQCRLHHHCHRHQGRQAPSQARCRRHRRRRARRPLRKPCSRHAHTNQAARTVVPMSRRARRQSVGATAADSPLQRPAALPAIASAA